MPTRSRVTRAGILAHAGRIVAQSGTEKLTFQALADELKVSKQAILYWYPDKWALIQELVLAGLEAEARATRGAVEGAKSGREAIALFLRSLVAHHRKDLGRFRLLYLEAQMERRRAPSARIARVLDAIHATTAGMYATLEAAIAADPGLAGLDVARRLAVAVHTAGVGALTMIALADAVDDPLRHDTDALVRSMITLMTAPASGTEAGSTPVRTRSRHRRPVNNDQ